MATAIALPAFNAMSTAPRRAFGNLHFPLRRKERQKLSIVGELNAFGRLELVHRNGKRHFSEAMMMAVRFSVRRQMDKLRLLSVLCKSSGKVRDKPVTTIKKTLERDPTSKPTMGEK